MTLPGARHNLSKLLLNVKSYRGVALLNTEKLVLKSSASCSARFVSNGNGSGKYKVGVFGAGRIASSVHIKNILRNRQVDVQWVIDDSPAAVIACKDLLNMHDVPFYTSKDTDKILSDESCDAVFVFSPTNTHADYICASLNKGKHVMTEKPCGENYEDIKRCYETAEKHNKILLTGFQRRFDETFADMKKAMEDGAVGDPRILRVTSRDSPKPSYEFLRNTDMEGCNIISDMAVHDIDTTVWLTSAERPLSVNALTHTHDSIMKEIGQPDTLVMTLKYASGVLAMLDIDRDCAYGYDMRIEIYGSKGMALAENPRESSAVLDLAAGANMRRLYNSFPQRFETAFETELQHFIDCMDGKVKPLVTKEECLLTMEIVTKALESYRTGQVVNF